MAMQHFIFWNFILLPHDSQRKSYGYDYEGSDEGNGVEDVDEEGEHLSVEMAREDGAERGEDDDDGDADNEVAPGIGLNTSVCHHLSPVKTCVHFPFNDLQLFKLQKL